MSTEDNEDNVFDFFSKTAKNTVLFWPYHCFCQLGCACMRVCGCSLAHVSRRRAVVCTCMRERMGMHVHVRTLARACVRVPRMCACLRVRMHERMCASDTVQATLCELSYACGPVHCMRRGKHFVWPQILGYCSNPKCNHAVRRTFYLSMYAIPATAIPSMWDTNSGCPKPTSARD